MYHPSKQERRSFKNDQKPMGSQVYDIPLNNHVAYQAPVWVDNTGYTAAYITPTAAAEGVPPTSEGVPPTGEPEAPTPALSVRSGTVTITYLDDNSSTTSTSLVPEPNNTEWNGDSTRPSTATLGSNRHDDNDKIRHASSSFEHYYSEAKGAEDDMYRLAVALEMDLSHSESNLHRPSKKHTSRSVSNIDIKKRRLSEEYDSLEPSPDLREAEKVDHETTDFDFRVLEELAIDSAAMASHSGTPDPYAPPPTSSDL